MSAAALEANCTLPLPITVPAVDAAWLTAALSQRQPGVRVLESHVVNVIYGTSTKIRVALRYNEVGQQAQLPSTLIVKGGFEEHSPAFGFMYRSEMHCYRDLLPQLDMPAPRCYFAGEDPDTYQAIVIMEDLQARGVRFLSAQTPLDYAQETRFLDAMARFHAQWWNRPEFEPRGSLDWVMTPFDEFSREYQSRYLQADVWDTYMAKPRGAATPRILHDRERMQRALDRLAEFHIGSPLTLVHGDTHLGNLYTEGDGTPGFLDMQVRRSPWYQDVAYHMTCALDVVDRRRWEQALLSYYLSRLSAYGVIDPPSFDQAWESYRRELVYGLFIFLINETRFQTEETNTANAVRFAMAAIDHGTFDALLN
jgi:aminoglycoside phosphotransferase (APT) family kinase protein